MSSKQRVLFVPHVGLGGGAGIYNHNLLRALISAAEVELGGRFSPEYEELLAGSAAQVPVPHLVLPNYEGVSLGAKLYWIVRSAWVAAMWWFSGPAMEARQKPFDVVVLTSSVQAPLLIFMGARVARRKVVVVQENLRLDGIIGATMRRLLRRADQVISITRTWQIQAASRGVWSGYLPNPFPDLPQKATERCPTFDAIYAGGDSRLKGFPEILAVFDSLARARPVRILLCGSYSASSMRRIASLNEKWRRTGSVLKVRGIVGDIAPYVEDARIVLLPIRHAHFCRLAIEAGFLNRTFIVSGLAGIEDFAEPGVNCLTFVPRDSDSFATSIMRLLDLSDLRHRLEVANRHWACERFGTQGWNAAALAAIEGAGR